MTYFAPFVDSTGLNIPTYQDIEDYLVNLAKVIYGNDIYLESDSQDFQLIAGQAQLIYDTLLTAQLVYNNSSPAYAIGASLDRLVALNGIARLAPTNSTASMILSGTPFTEILNGVVADVNGNLWDLPASVILAADGYAFITAICQTPGAVTALIGQINIIVTPTSGWATATNDGAANIGRGLETDTALRARHYRSVSLPSQALITGIIGGISAVPGVSSVQIYENDTNEYQIGINGVVNYSGYPPHSITCVVSGGDNAQIAEAIARKKTPGCYTNGDTSVVVNDQYGNPTTIRFERPSDVIIQASIIIKDLPGFSSGVIDRIKTAVADYLNSLLPGYSIINSEIWQAVLSVDVALRPTFSLQFVYINEIFNPATNGDITLQYNDKPVSDISQITVFVNPT